MYSLQMVCFCDIPVEALGIHVQKYGRFGIGFPKSVIVLKGGTPVRYVPRGAQVLVSGERSLEPMAIGEHFDKLVAEYHRLFALCRQLILASEQGPPTAGNAMRLSDLQTFLDFHVFSFFKFFDHTLSDEDPENYYLEREWRLADNLHFSMKDISMLVVPRPYGERLSADLPEYTGRRHLL